VTYTFLIDDFVTEEDAALHVSDLAIQRGYGIFDFFRVMDNHPLFLSDYLGRFFVSAREMQLEVPYSPGELASIIRELIRKNNMPMSGIKAILTGGYSADGYTPGKPNLIVTQKAMQFPPAELPVKGIKVITHEYLRDKPHVKTINYVVGIWIQKKVMEQQASDVLYHCKGVVSEFPRCNFFLVTKDNTIITPAENILEGVTRKHVLQLAAKKYTVRTGTVTLEDIYSANEAFLTSTSKRIVPITEIDQHVIGSGVPGPVSLDLLRDLLELEIIELGQPK
jgi:branched-chain amino acid aminotransferase